MLQYFERNLVISIDYDVKNNRRNSRNVAKLHYRSACTSHYHETSPFCPSIAVSAYSVFL